MNGVLINLLYLAASVLFIFGIKMLGSADTARTGNRLSSVGMLVAVVATLMHLGLDWPLVIGGILLGALLGAFAAMRVKMTGMPELVALFNGFGGLASLLVAAAEYAKVRDIGVEHYLDGIRSHSGVTVPGWFVLLAVGLTALVGGMTSTGSLVAWGKLAGKLGGKPALFRGQHLINSVLVLGALVAVALVAAAGVGPMGSVAGLVVCGLALALGVLFTVPIGGGDMPVVVALLNSLSGVAAAMAGFIILNNVLVVAGCLVGASGLILTGIMCKAMNRSLGNVLFGGFGAAAAAAGASMGGEMKPSSVDDAYFVLEAARSVVIVPGYGMAVAQAQHAVKELAVTLEDNGADVRFAIHPVAGRMPGHMNVLLAEADVPYEQLQEMDHVNSAMRSVDVAIVIGANDVVNPAANDDPSSSIYGMPIINVQEARTVYCLKRGKGAGFSGLENALFYGENTRMLFGDAKNTVSALVAEFQG